MKMVSQTCTLDEFERLIDLPENYDERLEWIEGVMYWRVPHWSASTNTAHITAYMGMYVIQHNAGYMLSAKSGYIIGGARLMPNASFVTKEKFATLPDEGFMSPAPDFAHETINPFEQDEMYVQKKLAAYGQEKIPLLWVFFPNRPEIHVYVNGEFIRTAGMDDTLDGSDVLPGFTMLVKDIFQ